MMELVFHDRKNNMNKAWETRKAMLEGGDDVQEDSQSGEENAISEEEGTVDKKFWWKVLACSINVFVYVLMSALLLSL